MGCRPAPRPILSTTSDLIFTLSCSIYSEL
jgi:hypothetical protein